MITFLKNLLIELSVNGKSLVAWAINEVPGLTGYPGVIGALKAVASDPTKSNAINLFFQLLFAASSGHRFIKVISEVANKKW